MLDVGNLKRLRTCYRKRSFVIALRALRAPYSQEARSRPAYKSVLSDSFQQGGKARGQQRSQQPPRDSS